MEPTEENMRAWEQSHESLGRLIESAIPDAVRAHFPDLTDKYVLSVGSVPLAVAELLELGARVTAVLGAHDLADMQAQAPGAAVVQADSSELPLELRRARFDLVYAGDGAFEFVRDVQRWISGVAAALRPGGRLVLQDAHPVGLALDEAGLGFRADYFATLTLGGIVTAVAQAGLVVVALEEHAGFYRSRLRNRRTPGDFLLVAEKSQA